MTDPRTILITAPDHERLTQLIEGRAGKRDAAARAALENELARARIVEPDEMPPDVVTMNSAVRFRDADGGEHEIRLVYPHGANLAQGRISVLAPVGSALLGLSVGQSIDWLFPDGRTRQLCVESVTYQPEAAGDQD